MYMYTMYLSTVYTHNKVMQIESTCICMLFIRNYAYIMEAVAV